MISSQAFVAKLAVYNLFSELFVVYSHAMFLQEIPVSESFRTEFAILCFSLYALAKLSVATQDVFSQEFLVTIATLVLKASLLKFVQFQSFFFLNAIVTIFYVR